MEYRRVARRCAEIEPWISQGMPLQGMIPPFPDHSKLSGHDVDSPNITQAVLALKP